MPRTCLACASPERVAIDKALAIGTPLRDIAGRWGISRSALDRHKSHVATAIIKAEERREENIGDSIIDKINGLQAKALELRSRMEEDGDYRGAIVAVREARECLISLDSLLAKAEALKAGSGGEVLVRVIHIGAKDGNEHQIG